MRMLLEVWMVWMMWNGQPSAVTEWTPDGRQPRCGRAQGPFAPVLAGSEAPALRGCGFLYACNAGVVRNSSHAYSTTASATKLVETAMQPGAVQDDRGGARAISLPDRARAVGGRLLPMRARSAPQTCARRISETATQQVRLFYAESLAVRWRPGRSARATAQGLVGLRQPWPPLDWRRLQREMRRERAGGDE